MPHPRLSPSTSSPPHCNPVKVLFRTRCQTPLTKNDGTSSSTSSPALCPARLLPTPLIPSETAVDSAQASWRATPMQRQGTAFGVSRLLGGDDTCADDELGYKTEQCSTDLNWCFTSAVGIALPSTFFSYPNATVQSLSSPSLSSITSAPSTTGSPDTSFLSFGTSAPSDSDYSPPTVNDWLTSIGDDDQEYDEINEALASTEYDSIPDGSDETATSSSSQVAPSPTLSSLPDPSSASLPGSAAQAAYAVDPIIGTATIPSSRLQQQGARRRSLGVTSLPQRAFLWSSSLQRHRFVARHRHAAARRSNPSTHVRRDSSSATIGYTPEQSVLAKGYADGWKAAKTFAAYNNSRLGMCSHPFSHGPTR